MSIVEVDVKFSGIRGNKDPKLDSDRVLFRTSEIEEDEKYKFTEARLIIIKIVEFKLFYGLHTL